MCIFIVEGGGSSNKDASMDESVETGDESDETGDESIEKHNNHVIIGYNYLLRPLSVCVFSSTLFVRNQAHGQCSMITVKTLI